jgi:hypothetical protein
LIWYSIEQSSASLLWSPLLGMGEVKEKDHCRFFCDSCTFPEESSCIPLFVDNPESSVRLYIIYQ